MDTERWVKSIIRGVMCLLGIIGNNWLCLSSLPSSISRLRTADVLFLNLAVSNLITNYLVDILNILQTENFLPMGNVFCGIQRFLPEFSETSSVLSTMFITVYWYQKLVGSLKRGGAPVQMDSLRLIAALLTASWTFSFLFHISHLFVATKDDANVTIEECKEELSSEYGQQAFELVYITVVNVIPLCCILYSSIQIVITLMQNKRRIKKTGEITSFEKSEQNSDNISTVTKSQTKSGHLVRAAKSVVVVAIFFSLCWIIHISVRLLSSVSPSSVVNDIESFIGASYTCTIPYIYLYGVQKVTCTRRTGRVRQM